MDLWSDTRFALRALARRPVAALALVATLALGIGASTAIFSVAKGVLYKPLAHAAGDRIVVVLDSNPAAGLPRFSVSAPNLRDAAEQTGSFAAFGGARRINLTLLGEGPPERLVGVMGTAAFYDVMGMPPRLGRHVQPADDLPGAPNVVVLAHGLWQRRFGGDESVLGRTVNLDGEPWEVIGVAPPGYSPFERDFFVPARLDYASEERGLRTLFGFARLAPGVSLERARADLAAISRRLAEAYPNENEGWVMVAETWQAMTAGPVRPALFTLIGAVSLLLLIAGVNAVNLLLARLAVREPEIAVRAALGAGRWPLVRGFLVESVLLTLVAGAAGLLLAALGTKLLLALWGDTLPFAGNVAMDTGVLLYALGLSIVVGLVCGLLPALRASRPDLRSALGEGGGHTSSRRGRRLRATLVLVEVSFATVLLVGAGLLVRSFQKLAAVDPGIETAGAMLGKLELSDTAYPTFDAHRAFYRRLANRLEELPGVTRSAVFSFLPLDGLHASFTYEVDDRPRAQPGAETFALVNSVGPGFFAALGTPIVDGRELAPSDDERAVRVAVVNERLARREWGDESPLGKRIDITYHEEEEPIWWTVVGVAADAQQFDDPTQPIRPEIFVPLLQYSFSQTFSMPVNVMVGTEGDPGRLAGVLRTALAELDPALPLFEVKTLAAHVDASLSGQRFNAILVGVFALLALLLAAIGVYGVVAYGVEQRRRELAVRQALGAGATRIVRLVVRQGMTPVLLGIVAGCVGAVAANRLIAGLLYGVGAADPASWLVVTAVLVLVGLIACWVPSVRAVRVDPWTVLREE